MPKQIAKQEVLGGAVVQYGSGTSKGKFFFRKWNPEAKRYSQKLIPGATSMEEALNGVIDVAFDLRQSNNDIEAKPRRVRSSQSPASSLVTSQPIHQTIAEYLRNEEERAEGGLISINYFKIKANVYRKYLLPYLSAKGIEHTKQITQATFEDYLVFRQGTTAIVRSQERKYIKNWLHYLAKRELIPAAYLLSRDFLPLQRVTEADRLANPAINSDDWKIIINYVRDEWKEQVKSNVNRRYYYWRTLVWHYLLFSKNTGMSPEEIIRMKWKQIEIVDEGRINSKGERVPWEVAYVSTIRAKTKQAREIPCNQARELRRWKEFVLHYCKEFDLPMPDANTVVFGNPFMRSGSKEGWRPYHKTQFNEAWVQIRNAVSGRLKGHRHSDHVYTLYSLRATFIEDHLLKGTSVVATARMAGHNIVETQRSYERLDLRRKGMEITAPEFGKRRTKGDSVEQLF